MTALLQWFVITEKGQVREANEDSVQSHPDLDTLRENPTYQPPGGRLCVVADGMGGHRGGKEASRMAVQRISQLYYTHLQDTTIDQALLGAIQQTNHDIVQVGQSDSSLEQMGTTVVLATALTNQLYVANVGDSRAYIWRNGTVKLISQDDRWVAQQMRNHVLTEEQARNHEYRNLLTQYLGNPEGVQPHMTLESLSPDDRILLCTDGLYEVVTDEEISKMLGDSPERAAVRLIKLALARHSPDNITVAVGYYGPLHPSIRRSTSSRNPLSRLAALLHINVSTLLIAAMMVIIALVLFFAVALPALLTPPDNTGGTAITTGQPTTRATQVTSGEDGRSFARAQEPSPVPRPTSTMRPATPTPPVTATPVPPVSLPETLTITSTEHYTAIMQAAPQPVAHRTLLESSGWAYTYRGDPPGPMNRIGEKAGNLYIVITVVYNKTGQPQPVPPDFFVLKDEQGRAYCPVSELAQSNFGGADLTMQDVMPADGMERSISVIFDVAPDATGLVFFALRNPQQGWSITGQ